MPSSWNGILVLYSHGFGPPLPANAPDAGDARRTSCARLRARRLVVRPRRLLVGAEHRRRDQFATIGAVTAAALPHAPERVLAFGTSMGGLVSALEAEQGAGIIDGALSTCGLVAGAIHLNNYQLDAEYAIAKLLMPAPGPKLVDFANPGEGAASGAALTAAVQAAQTTPEGRARLSLVFALLNVVPVAPGVPEPAPNDAEAIEAAQYASAVQSFPLLNFIQFGRYWIELAAGGNGSWTRGEDFAELLSHSPYHDVVRNLYRTAGLDLKADLEALDAGAAIGADPDAIASLEETSVPTGDLAGSTSSRCTRPQTRWSPSSTKASTRTSFAVPGPTACCGRHMSTAGATAASRRPSWWRVSRRSGIGSTRGAGTPSRSRRRCRRRRAPSASATQRSCRINRRPCPATTARSTPRRMGVDVELTAAASHVTADSIATGRPPESSARCETMPG